MFSVLNACKRSASLAGISGLIIVLPLASNYAFYKFFEDHYTICRRALCVKNVAFILIACAEILRSPLWAWA